MQCVCVYVCVCVNIAGSIPAEYGFTRLSSPSLSLGGYQQPNVYVCVCLSTCGEKKRKKKKKGIVTGQNQPLRAVWCNTRLLNSGGQFDQTCNLFGGAIPAQGLC